MQNICEFLVKNHTSSTLSAANEFREDIRKILFKYHDYVGVINKRVMLGARYIHTSDGNFSIWIKIWVYLYNDPLKTEDEIIQKFPDYKDIHSALERMMINKLIDQDEDTGEYFIREPQHWAR